MRELTLAHRKSIVLLFAAVFIAACRGARAQTAPQIALETVLTGLAQPTAVAHVGDARLFLTLQGGQIVVVENGAVRSSAFLDIRPLVGCCGERGLLGLAFHPRYGENGFFFVDYTNIAGDTVIARYRVSQGNPNAADPASGVILLTIAQPFANHNGGQVAFGPDGYLYVGMGDGGSANDPMCHAQRDDSLLGKILRIDVDASPGSPPFYGIPPDNPFAAPGGTRDEIWAKGLRNPWRFSFDRETGDLYIGDVGQGAREEIDFQPAGSPGGENYGWKPMEGTVCGGGGTSGCPSGTPPCNAPGYVAPIAEYSHGAGDCSVTGGYVYRGRSFPQLVGTYLYADYCTGRIWGARREGSGWSTQLFSPRAPSLTTFGEDAAGELYVATEGGTLARIVNANPVAITLASLSPASGAVRGGESVVVNGAGFLPDTVVTFGGIPAATVGVLDSVGTRLLVITPAHAAGAVDVVATNPDGRAATLSQAYAFTPLTQPAPRERTPRVVVPRPSP